MRSPRILCRFGFNVSRHGKRKLSRLIILFLISKKIGKIFFNFILWFLPTNFSFCNTRFLTNIFFWGGGGCENWISREKAAVSLLKQSFNLRDDYVNFHKTSEVKFISCENCLPVGYGLPQRSYKAKKKGIGFYNIIITLFTCQN